MPKKNRPDPVLHPKIHVLLTAWGRAIRTQRVRQRVTAGVFCPRIGVSESTLRRIERGDPTVSVGSYLDALNALALLDYLVPVPDAKWYEGSPTARAAQRLEHDEDFPEDLA